MALYRLVMNSLVACSTVFGLAGWLSAEDVPGLSKEKPTSGRYVEVDGGYMVPYSIRIPGTDAEFEMIPVPGGTYWMGSPETEVGRGSDEGPQVRVTVEPFWMAKCEVSWSEYKPFMKLYNVFKRFQSSGIRKVNTSNLIDVITAPTPLYQSSHTFEFGEEPKQPAVTMTQYAAKQYSKWLSTMLDQQLRLPCEAEWEYAARAGTDGPYSFGSNVEELNQYACFDATNPTGPGLVGERLPNNFGLHDMHGNVWEWTIDGYDPEGYNSLAAKEAKLPKGQGDHALEGQEAVQWTESAYPRTVRGGGWQDPPSRLRSASRMGSDDEDWKSEDPNFPLSPWWYTSDPARGVGFRLVRSYRDLPADTIKRYWEIDNEDIDIAVQMRMEEGRGSRGITDPSLKIELDKLK